MDDIAGWRKRIDEIDEKLLELLNKRAEYAMEIGRIKREKSIAVYDSDREKSILARMTAQNRGPLPNDAVKRLFEYLIIESRNLE